MNASDYIKNQLTELSFNFPYGRFAYEYDLFSGMHLVQVWPVDLYEANNLYKEAETYVSVEFDNIYYPESILFVSENSLNQVHSPSFEISGIFYGIRLETSKFVHDHFNLRHEPFIAGENNFALAA